MRQLRVFTSIRFRLACVLLVSLTVTGCFTEPDYPDVPQIDFKGISRYTLAAGTGVGQQKRDSLVITIGFKDGDGDLGNNGPLIAWRPPASCRRVAGVTIKSRPFALKMGSTNYSLLQRMTSPFSPG
jgi:hypothetical protein